MTLDLLRNAELWVAVGLLLFFALLFRLRVHTGATAALDARGAKIKAALDEAEALRLEARAMLDGLKSQRATAEVEAAQLLEEARLAAVRLEAEAKARLEAQIARRTELADRRIAAAEAQASAEVKAAAAEFAIETTRAIVGSRLTSGARDPQFEAALARLPSARLQ